MSYSSAAELATEISFSKKNGGPLPKMEACNCLQPSQEIRYIIVLLYIQSLSHKNSNKKVAIVLSSCNLVSSRPVTTRPSLRLKKDL